VTIVVRSRVRVCAAAAGVRARMCVSVCACVRACVHMCVRMRACVRVRVRVSVRSLCVLCSLRVLCVCYVFVYVSVLLGGAFKHAQVQTADQVLPLKAYMRSHANRHGQSRLRYFVCAASCQWRAERAWSRGRIMSSAHTRTVWLSQVDRRAARSGQAWQRDAAAQQRVGRGVGATQSRYAAHTLPQFANDSNGRVVSHALSRSAGAAARD
jgi:hypothetical protein